MSHVKTTFPSGWYHFRCTQVDEDDQSITITFTCDTGERSYQHIICTFDRTTQRGQIEKMNTRGCFSIAGVASDPFYSVQYLGQRCEAKVDSVAKSIKDTVFITNIIVDWKPAVVDPDYNVMRPKSDALFYKQKNKKKLPV